jgi:hypothetical protein
VNNFARFCASPARGAVASLLLLEESQEVKDDAFDWTVGA